MAPPLHRASSADFISPKTANSNMTYADSVAGLLLQIENQSLPVKTKTRVEPKNFARINLVRIREMQKLCRQANQNKNAPVKTQYNRTNDLYRDVPSRLSEYLNTSRTLPNISQNLASRCGTEQDHTDCWPTPQVPGESRRRTSIKEKQDGAKLQRIKTPHQSSSENKIPQLNLGTPDPDLRLQRKMSKLHEKPPPCPSAQPKSSLSSMRTGQMSSAKSHLALPVNYKLGTVPKYLQERQKSWVEEAEKRRLETPDPSVPSGHELLSETERTETLDKLQNNYKELLKQMTMLPIRMDTLRIQQQKEDLEKRLVKIEEAIKIFSQSKVFIKKNV